MLSQTNSRYKGLKMKYSRMVFLATVALFMSACDVGSDISPGTLPTTPAAATARFQALHASPDAPKVNLSVDGEEIASGVDYLQATGLRSGTAGSSTVAVDAILPGDTVNVFEASLPFAEDTITTVVAVGPVAVPLDVAVATQPDEPVTAGNARLLVIHGTSGDSLELPTDLPVDVYLTPIGLQRDMPLNGMTPLLFKGSLGPAEVPAGDYGVEIVYEGGTVYSSGPVTLNDGDDLRLVAVPARAGVFLPVDVIALSADGAASLGGALSSYRLGHLSADAGNVDIVPACFNSFADVAFPTVTDFSSPVQLGDFTGFSCTVAVSPASIPAGSGMPVLEDVVRIEAGTWDSLFVLGVAADDALEIAQFTSEPPRSVALYAQARVYHAAATAPDVDVYVTEVGAFDAMDADQEPAIAGFEFGASTGYVLLDEGTYDVTVTVAGDKTAVAIGPATATVANGDVVSIIARDPIAPATDFGLVIVSDL